MPPLIISLAPSMSDRADRPPHIHNMDPVAALLNAAVCFGAACCIELLEDVVRARSAELESRTATLDSMPDEIQQLIFGQLRKVLDPHDAVDYSSASKGLREPMQRIGEGASKSLLQQLKEENAAAAGLCLKMLRPGVRSCKALREEKKIWWFDTGLSATDLAMLSKLIPLLPALESLCLKDYNGISYSAAGGGGQRLVEGLGVGVLPAVTDFRLTGVYMGDAGAWALAAALDRGALQRLKHLHLCYAALSRARVETGRDWFGLGRVGLGVGGGGWEKWN